MVNMYKQGLTILQQEILRLLFAKSGMSLNQRGVARMLDVSQPAVMKSLPGLKKKNLIKINQDKESRRWAIEFNRDNLLALQLKRVDNLKQIYESGLFTFLKEELPGAVIILFGSYSRGDDTIYSDIDIAIIGRKEKNIKLEKFIVAQINKELRNPENKELWSIKAKTRKMMCVIPELTL